MDVFQVWRLEELGGWEVRVKHRAVGYASGSDFSGELMAEVPSGEHKEGFSDQLSAGLQRHDLRA